MGKYSSPVDFAVYPCYYVVMKIGFIGLGNMASGTAKNIRSL